jgi:hypothetical protein
LLFAALLLVLLLLGEEEHIQSTAVFSRESVGEIKPGGLGLLVCKR